MESISNIMLVSVFTIFIATAAPVREHIKLIGGCVGTEYGCCPDNITPRNNTIGTNCVIQELIGGCIGTEYGCCPDYITPRNNTIGTNCVINPTSSTKNEYIGGCISTEHGCCPDNITPRNNTIGTNCY